MFWAAPLDRNFLLSIFSFHSSSLYFSFTLTSKTHQISCSAGECFLLLSYLSHICPAFYDECLLAPVLPYRGDLHKAVHDIIRSVTPLKKIVFLYFLIKFEVPMLTALKYYNRETSAVHRRTYRLSSSCPRLKCSKYSI